MSSAGSAARLLRRATERDVPRVVEIERASFGDPWSAGSFRALLGNPAVSFSVATDPDGGGVCGYVVTWLAMDEAEIANLAVASGARGRGMGGVLLDTALAEATARGVRRVFLEVRDSNHAARALYRSRGFVEVGRRRSYYRRPVEDAVVMRWPGPTVAGGGRATRVNG